MSSFQFVALAAAPFAPLFRESDEQLRSRGARRMVVDDKPGYPCRVSLADADVGETVLLLPFIHHDVSSPCRGSGPIYVREGVATAVPAPGEIPLMFAHRLLSVRAYDEDAMLLEADVVDGSALEETIRRFLSRESVSYLHLHNAKPGCYNCRVVRA